MRGFVSLEKHHVPSGKIEVIDFGQNLIVNSAKFALCKLLAASSAANYYVDRMAFGTSTVAEALGDTTLVSQITPMKPISLFEPPPYGGDPFLCRFTAILDVDEANGFPIAEAGLLTANLTLVARKVFPSQLKSSDYIFTFHWTVASS